MECDVCGRGHDAKALPFLCPVDARNQLYEKRVALAEALMENEQIEQQLNTLLENPTSSKYDSPASKRIRLEALKSDEQRALDSTNNIIAQADKLRAHIEAARKGLDERRAAMTQRSQDLSNESNGSVPGRAKQLEDSGRYAAATKFRWNRMADTLASTRGFLCMEAAKLYGLRRVKKGNSVHYEIGGIEIMELSAMNMTSPEEISTCLAHITHILMLASHYLALRLPAEITLPHRDYARPTIFTLQSSYKTNPSSHPPPPESKLAKDTEGRPATPGPRPRPLHVDKPLPLLAKEDPLAHKMFIEGVALLAYNVAWVCCTQGVPIGEKSALDDIFSIGRNLYSLLIGNQRAHHPAGRPLPPTGGDGELGSLPNGNTAVAPMGRWSHGSSHDFLGDEAVRGFRLPNPKSLTDRLRGKLSSEGPVADWEVLEDDAWAADEHLEEGVLTSQNGNGRMESNRRLFGVESVVTVRPGMDETLADMDLVSRPGDTPGRRIPGISGWTKLKPR